MRHTPVKLLLAFAFLLIALPAFGAETRGVKRVEIKTQAGESVGLYEESHALVIGVSAYEHWPKLPGVKRDVTDVAAALEKNGFSVQTVLDPDQDMLDDAFEGFIEEHGGNPENRLLFYFAGHGHTVQPKFGGEPLGYLVPIDAPVPTLGKRAARRFKRVAMSMQRIEEYALNIDAKHALFLFDACFSGSLFALSRAIPESINYKTTKPVRQFITSGSAEETVPDQSIFRSQFVAALEGDADANGDGYLSGTELGEFLQDSVVNYSKGAQHPQYGKIRNPNLDKGDFVFALPKTAREPEPSSTAAAPASATPSTSSPSEFRADEEAWKDIKNSNDPDDFRFFLEEFPASPLAKTAKFKLRRLERKQVKAEQQQIAEAKRKVAEEQKQQLAEEAKQEEERNRIEQEQRRIAEAKRKADEKQKSKAEEERKSQIVIDSFTGLMWQKEPDGIRRNWIKAKSYCESLKLGGYSDWVLPNKDMLEDMVAKKDLFGPFKRTADYWSSKVNPSYKSSSWYINFGQGKGRYSNLQSHARCVRDGLKNQAAALRKKQESSGVWTESNTGMKFRRIPGGSFRMGSPSSEEGRKDNEKQHTVRVGEFWLAETEVTLGQFSRFVRDSGYRPQSESMGCWWNTGSKWEESKSKNWRSPGFSQLDSQPVVCVSWNDAVAYTQWLTKKTGKHFRLPTESEWEYAARAGTQTARYWGEAIGHNHANCVGCGSRWDGDETAPAGSFKPNAFGLFDMLGNVVEWTCSQDKRSYDGSEQECSVSARTYSLRGGSWSSDPGWVRAADRDYLGPDVRNNYIGFRLARD